MVSGAHDAADPVGPDRIHTQRQIVRDYWSGGAAKNPAIDAGVRLAGFNDDYTRSFETGKPPLRFGLEMAPGFTRAPWEMYCPEVQNASLPRAPNFRFPGPAMAYSNGSPMSLEELRARYRNEIIALAAKRGGHNIRVFGSVARGQERLDSDIDFLVDFEPGRSLLDLTGLWLDLEAALGCKVDVVSSRGLKPRLASEVMRDAVSL